VAYFYFLQEFRNAPIEHRPGADYADKGGDFVSDPRHGSGVASKVLGRYLGVAKEATVVVLDKKYFEDELEATMSGQTTVVREKFLESLLNAADDIATKKRSGKSVVNMSFGMLRGLHAPPPFFNVMRKSSSLLLCGTKYHPFDLVSDCDIRFPLVGAILQELDKLDTVLVATAGNDGEKRDGIHDYPAKFLEEGSLPNMIVVGSTDVNCRRASRSSHADWMTTYAP
jgi:hypothetical protein